MNKTKFLSFVSLYNLGGLIEAAKITIKDNVLSTSFLADDKSMAGTVTLTPFTFEDTVFGLNRTSEFRKMFGPLLDELEMSFTKFNDKPVGVSFTDADGGEMVSMLAELGVIPNAPKIKEPTDYDVEVTIDKAFISRFIGAKNTLPDVDSFTFLMNKKDKLNLVIGWAPSINTDRQVVPITTVAGKDKVAAPISFNAKYFKEILSQNSDATGAVLKVSEKGIAVVTFTVDVGDGDKITSTYYLIQKKLEA